MLPKNTNEVREYFNTNWQDYISYVKENRLHHYEMFAALNQFILKNMGEQAFTFVDVGCGDSSSIFINDA